VFVRVILISHLPTATQNTTFVSASDVFDVSSGCDTNSSPEIDASASYPVVTPVPLLPKSSVT